MQTGEHKSRVETSLSGRFSEVMAWGVAIGREQGNRLQCTTLRTGEGQMWHLARGGKKTGEEMHLEAEGVQNLKGKLRV